MMVPFNKKILFEQQIKKQVTVTAGSSGSVTIPMPNDQDVLLKGYGYDWYTSNTFRLRTDNIVMPVRTDQEGSIAQPRIFEFPLPVRRGGNITFTINNSDSVDHTYQFMVVLYVSQFLDGPDYQSVGGAILLATEGAGSGGAVTPIAVFDSTGTFEAGVTVKGLQVETNAPATLRCGTVSTTASTALALASTTALKKGVLVQADYANTDYVLVGNASSQLVRLYAGDSLYIDIDDLAKVYIKRPSAVDVTVNFEGA